MAKKIIQTVLIIHQKNRILLGLKKRGFGAKRWNGFGGKVEDHESIRKTVFRETKEEACLEPLKIKKRGVIDFEFKGQEMIIQVHFFSSDKFRGKPKETEEMRPRWFDLNKIPYRRMWPDDKLWLPIMLSGRNFHGKVYFKDSSTIIKHKILIKK